MQDLLKKLFSFRYVPGEPRYIPSAFWLHPVGGLLIKARCRIFDDQLITIAEAARLARVSSATVSIAIDKGDLLGVTDPSARRRQGHRRVLRSEVIARWVEKEPPDSAQPKEEWKVFEHRVAGGNQVVVVLNEIILNQWIHHFGQKRTIKGHSWQVLGTERYEQGEGNPEWVGQSAAILTGKHFRQIRIPEEIHYQLLTNVHVGGGKTAPAQEKQANG